MVKRGWGVEVKWRAKSNLGQEMVTTVMRRRADVWSRPSARGPFTHFNNRLDIKCTAAIKEPCYTSWRTEDIHSTILIWQLAIFTKNLPPGLDKFTITYFIQLPPCGPICLKHLMLFNCTTPNLINNSRTFQPQQNRQESLPAPQAASPFALKRVSLLNIFLNYRMSKKANKPMVFNEGNQHFWQTFFRHWDSIEITFFSLSLVCVATVTFGKTT